MLAVAFDVYKCNLVLNDCRDLKFTFLKLAASITCLFRTSMGIN